MDACFQCICIYYCVNEKTRVIVVEGVTKELKLLLVEDEALYRDLLAMALTTHQNIQVVGAYEDGGSALAGCRNKHIDVAVLDIELPGEYNGIQLGLALRNMYPKIGIVLLSNHSDPAFFSAIPQDKVNGWSYLSKKSVGDIEALHRAIVGAAEGLVVLDQQLVDKATPRKGSLLEQLTPRQQEIISLIAQGYSNAAIAERLVLAPKSVENHISQMYQVLDIDTHNPQIQPRVTAVLTYLQQMRI
jgi:DNA-binding NarL/FixJ family response regulator